LSASRSRKSRMDILRCRNAATSRPCSNIFAWKTVDQYRYAAAIGSLMYAAIATRPDIAYAVQTLSQFTSNPSTAHWTAIKHVLRYLSGTRDHALTYGDSNMSTMFTSFTDADWGSNPVDRKSISGNVCLLAGGAICWTSRNTSDHLASSTLIRPQFPAN